MDSSVIDLDVTEDHPIEPITQKDSIDLKDVTADVAVQQDEYKPLEGRYVHTLTMYVLTGVLHSKTKI